MIGGSDQRFLEIGLRDAKPEHKIFRSTNQSWAQSGAQPNLSG